jgi:type I restriction enzyme, S subunit
LEVKPGYKATEVGVIPEDWEVERIGKLGDVVRGASPRPAGDPRYFNGDFIPWLTVAALTNIPEHQLLVTETVGYLTEEGSRHSRMLSKGTVIIANSGATLGVAKLLGVTCCANDGIAAILNQGKGDKAFVCHYVNTCTQNLREVVATGNGQPNLNTGLIRAIRIPFPPVPEQRAIAAALSDVDALLDRLTLLIAKKRDLKQAAMQQLLTGQTRLPGFHGAWEVKRLGDIAPLQRGFDLPISQLRAGPVPVVYSNGVLNFHSQFQANGPGVVTGRSGTIGKVTFVEGPYWPHNTALWVTSFKNNDPRFVFYLYTRIGFARFATGSGVPTLNRNDVHSFEAAIPPTKAEQTKIAAVLSDMDAELSALKARRDKTRALKQAMMQELLTGRTRLV